MLQHDGKKPHSCNQCGYSTISASQLKTHMLVHSGEKISLAHSVTTPAQQLVA